jgi:hypothetical protein
MMQPRFDDLIEYVRAGETDPDMQELLAGNPDGQELLKQARYICKLLRERYGASDDLGNVAAGDIMSARMSEELTPISESRAPEEALQSRTFYQSAPLRQSRRRRPPSIERLLAGIDAARQDLGTLSFAANQQRLSASYEPSLVVAAYAKKFLRKVPTNQLGLLGMQIQSRGLNISLPESIAVGESITLRLSTSLRQTPLRYLDVVFMPESGPFVRFQSDDKGDAVLPAPLQSGVLRIGSSELHFLRIKVEES